MTAFHLVVQGLQAALAGAEALRRISGGGAIEAIGPAAVRIRDADPETAEGVAAHCEGRGLDWGFVAEGRRLADFGLLAMDMDSTLITAECIDEIADFAGRKAEVAAVTAAAMRGDIDWPQSLRRRVAALAGLDASVLERVYRERLFLTPGAETLLAAARRAGLRTLLVSGGFTYFTERLKRRAGLGHTLSNVLEIREGRLTGRIEGGIVDAAAKAGALRALRDGLSRGLAVAFGDGANDLPMFREADVSIAYRAKPIVRSQATHAIDLCGLDAALNLFA
jgi:phosphoserine phosphatase